jgi:hypothetical protein
MLAEPQAAVDLYWLPLGAGGHFVRMNGRIYEALVAWRAKRPRRDLYHSALIVTVPAGAFVIEQAWPIPGGDKGRRGTGFGVDHSWIKLPIADDNAATRHRRGVTEVPGLYFLGMPWQHTRGSALLGWVKGDAEYIASQIGDARAHQQQPLVVPSVQIEVGASA